MGNRFRDRVALITGEDHDLIKEMSTFFSSEGAAILANCSHSKWIDSVVSEINATGGMARSGHFDLTSMEHAESLVKFTVDSFGKVDALVFGIMTKDEGSILDFMPGTWDELIRPVLKSVFAITKYVSAQMRRQNSGNIINIITDKGLQSDISSTHAVITEAIIGFTRTVALDMGKYGVGCNTVISGHAKNAALISAYICNNLGTSASGNVFRIDEQEVSLYSVPAVERGIYSSEIFSVEELDTLVPQYLFGQEGSH